MKIVQFRFVLLVLLGASINAVSTQWQGMASERHPVEFKRSVTQTHWTYGQDNAGPQDWGKLDPLYGKCGVGFEQSPIDVSVGAPYVHLEINPFAAMSYPPIYNALCGYNGHTVQCEWNSATKADNQTITIQGKTYKLIQFHFHTPSEHRIENRFADAELHLVHQSTAGDGALAVIGLLLEVQQRNNPVFDWLVTLGKLVDWTKVHTSANEADQVKYHARSIDLASLLMIRGKTLPAWQYEGSLTTPPCTEGVSWSVIQRPVGIGLKQLDALAKLEGFNARFLQDRPDALMTEH